LGSWSITDLIGGLGTIKEGAALCRARLHLVAQPLHFFD
jgi:hypothetical protein